MSLDLPALTQAVAQHGAVVRILVCGSAGSAPREAGTSMLVTASTSTGTIGGGALEHQAIAKAREMIGGPQARLYRKFPLGPDLGQCCGGQMSLVWEVFTEQTLPRTLPFARPLSATGALPDRLARRLTGLPEHFSPMVVDGWLIEGPMPRQTPLWIWGAGHVGRALVDVLHPLPDWQITWVDTGPERFPEQVPHGVTTLPAADPALLARHAPTNAEHLVLTFSHALDLALCDALLRRGYAGLGLIGSATKWARFRKRLAELGHTPEAIMTINCPIGEPELGKHPHAIALGVAVSLQRQAIGKGQQGMTESARDSA